MVKSVCMSVNECVCVCTHVDACVHVCMTWLHHKFLSFYCDALSYVNLF